MKILKVLLTSFLLLFVLVSISNCKKQNSSFPTTLVGKWKLAEGYLGYFNGGDFKWSAVSASNSYTFQFGQSGSFQQDGGLSASCFPATFIQKDSVLIITYSCNKTDTSFIEKLASDTLILKYKVIEGVIKSKFYKIQ
jgi:hypothetical protein